MSLRQEILDYVKKEYATTPEHLWRSYPTYEVLRHEVEPGEKKAKWYGIIMDVKRSVLGLPGDGYVDILNVKLDPDMIEFLKRMNGYFPAYHMNKQSWITILLDGSVPIENIKQQIDESFVMTASVRGKRASGQEKPRDWIVPANPKYFDLISAFEENDIIIWKQSSDVHVGDLVYMYVAAPYSALMYKCKAIEVDIPWDYQDRDLRVKKVMKIQLLASYGADLMTLDRMKTEFGIYAVRGPRSMPNSLKKELEFTV